MERSAVTQSQHTTETTPDPAWATDQTSPPGASGGQRDPPLPAAIACITSILALLVLIGWFFDIPHFKHVIPTAVAMNPVTAGTLLMSCAALWLLRDPPRDNRTRARANALAWLVVAVGLAKLAGQWLDLEPGVDQLLFPDRLGAPGEARPNRMAPNTALNFVLLGLALRFLDGKGRGGVQPAQYFALAVALVAGMALLGYGYGVRSLYGVGTYVPMAVHTAAAFLLLAIAVLAARPRTGLMSVFAGNRPHNVLARRLAGGTLAILVSLGWLRLKGERLGLYDSELGVTFFTAATILLTLGLITWGTFSLDRSESRRRHVEDERERFFAVTPDMMCIADFQGRLLSLNPAWERLTGYSCDELRAQPVTAFLHADDRRSMAQQLARLGNRAEGDTVSFEVRFCRKDHRMRWFAWNAMPVAEEGLLYATVRDITSRKDIEANIRTLNADLVASAEQLKQSNRELEAFTYTVSHDLRAPLRHIDGYAQMLREDGGDQLEGALRRYLDTICLSAQRMGTLIDDLLAFSRLGRKPVAREDVDMGLLVERALVEAGSHPASSAIELGSLPPAHADPVLMRQVWVNLLSNAIKYSSGSGRDIRIQVSGEVAGDVVRYQVRDNGVGFDMRYADQLFGVFQRLHSSDDFEGTGVGLAIVQRVVARHGGRIWAEAEPGAGATFTFELPRTGSPGESAA